MAVSLASIYLKRTAVKEFFLSKKDKMTVDDNDIKDDKDIYQAYNKDETAMTSTFDTDSSETN